MTKYVELETAIDAVNDVYYDSPDINLSADKLEDALRGVPYADVVPVVHGKWIPVDDAPPCGEWSCTACGDTRTFVFDMSADDMRDCYAYCPNCGARMDLEAL